MSEEKKLYQTAKEKGLIAFVIAIVIGTLYYFAQVMGWIDTDSKKDVKVKETVKMVETASKSYK